MPLTWLEIASAWNLVQAKWTCGLTGQSVQCLWLGRNKVFLSCANDQQNHVGNNLQSTFGWSNLGSVQGTPSF